MKTLKFLKTKEATRDKQAITPQKITQDALKLLIPMFPAEEDSEVIKTQGPSA